MTSLPKPTEIDLDGDPKDVAKQAMALYLHAREEIARVEEQWKPWKDHAREALAWALERIEARKVKTEFGQAYTTSGYTRVIYDAEKLDKLLERRPKLRKFLEPLRTEKEYAGRLTVRIE